MNHYNAYQRIWKVLHIVIICLISFQKFQKLPQKRHFHIFQLILTSILTPNLVQIYLKIAIFANKSYLHFLRYGKPWLLIIYVIPSHRCWKLSQVSILDILCQFLAPILTPVFAKMLLKCTFFALIMPILS